MMRVRDHWVDLLHRSATGTATTRKLLTPIGVVIFGTFTVAFVFAAVAVDRAMHLPGLLPEGVRFTVAVPVIIVGLAVVVWSALHFLRVNGTPVPFNPPPTVVDTGPYGFVRNPMLTGVFVMLLGLGLAVDSFSLIVIFMPLYIVLNVWELKRIEEPELVRRLGQEYLEYRRRTPMFIPGLRRE